MTSIIRITRGVQVLRVPPPCGRRIFFDLTGRYLMKHHIRRLASVFAVATLVLFSATANAQGSQPTIAVDCHDVVVDPPSGNVRFTILFNRAPDFNTVDAIGRSADGFQYYVQTVTEASFPREAHGEQEKKFARMIMGIEIPGDGRITIREVVPNYDSASNPIGGRCLVRCRSPSRTGRWNLPCPSGC